MIISKRQRWVPHKYQKRARKWLVDRDEAALFCDPGLGKTSIALSAFLDLQKKGKANAAIVLAPRRVCYEVWTQKQGGELNKWAQFKDVKVALLHGTKKDDVLEQAIADGDVDLFVINYEGLPWLVDNERILRLAAIGVDTVIFDEVSKLKASNTKRFKLLKKFLQLFPRRWGLTGSPASNNLLDLFGEMYVIDRGKSLGQYITHFRTKYFVPSGYKGYQWTPHEGTEDEIFKAIKDVALSMRAEDHLDLPSLVESDLWVDLPKKAREAYDEVEKEFFLSLDNGKTVTAANSAVASGKCRQIASGGIYIDSTGPDDPRWAMDLHNEKTEALDDLVSELQGSPLLVGFEFHHDLERIRNKLGKDVPAIYGGTGDKETSRLVRAWNAGDLPVLCAHPASMAHGLNMQSSGSHICWYTCPWNFELYDQFIRRVWRQGQKANRVVVHRILARKTVDEVVSVALRGKQRTQDSLMDALKLYRRL
jgi:SNF2 family DNA or RNA helicase